MKTFSHFFTESVEEKYFVIASQYDYLHQKLEGYYVSEYLGDIFKDSVYRNVNYKDSQLDSLRVSEDLSCVVLYSSKLPIIQRIYVVSSSPLADILNANKQILNVDAKRLDNELITHDIVDKIKAHCLDFVYTVPKGVSPEQIVKEVHALIKASKGTNSNNIDKIQRLTNI